jgi:hypothetical protein
MNIFIYCSTKSRKVGKYDDYAWIRGIGISHSEFREWEWHCYNFFELKGLKNSGLFSLNNTDGKRTVANPQRGLA